MIEHIMGLLEHAGVAIALFAVAVIVCSVIISAWRYIRQFHLKEADLAQNFSRFKKELGSGLLLGLEILVLADVIETMTTKPSYASLSMLGFIVVIRTVLSWTLTLEAEGRWPWQLSGTSEKNA